MRCSRRAAENPDRAKFCVECASPFARLCPSCNAENPPSARFCLECAQPLEAKANPPTTDTASPRQARDGERHDLTVLLCDLVDSTEIAGRLDPEDWRDIAGGVDDRRRGASIEACFGWRISKDAKGIS
jgi:hypothetical protein